MMIRNIQSWLEYQFNWAAEESNTILPAGRINIKKKVLCYQEYLPSDVQKTSLGEV